MLTLTGLLVTVATLLAAVTLGTLVQWYVKIWERRSYWNKLPSWHNLPFFGDLLHSELDPTG